MFEFAKRLLSCIALYCYMLSAYSATATTTFQVTATVAANCEVTANTLAFGSYDPISVTDTDAASTISATCTNGVSYGIGLNAGVGTGATVSDRKMTGPSSSLLDYAIYTDAGRTTIWENTGGTVVSGTGNGAVQDIDVYGRIPNSQTVISGAYADTITVTITF
jgi:spore coat protein U-like protein